MHGLCWIFALAVLLAGCGGLPAAERTLSTATSAPPPASASAVPSPTAPPATPRAVATARPTAGQATAPAATRSIMREAVAQTTPIDPAGGQTLRNGPFDLAAQSAALLPEFQSDMDRAPQWNRYTISALIDADARTVSGRARVEYTNRDSVPLDRLHFHLYPNHPDFGGRLAVDSATVDGQPAPIDTEGTLYVLRVGLPQPLPPGATATVELAFRAQATENSSRSSYGAFNKEGGVLALASSYPIAAVVRDGVWDIGPVNSQGDFVNSETALYDVTLTTQASWKLVTTGVAIEWQSDGEWQRARFVSGPQRDFMISLVQLASASAEVDGTRITSYFRPGGDAGGQAALLAASNALRAFNARFGRYPLAELDVVEFAASTFLGVEYPGIILIERGIYDEPFVLEITVAHEVAHQWWYSLVGNDVQTEAWIDEGLASFSQIIYAEQVGDAAAAQSQLDDFRQRYRRAQEAGVDAPLAQPTASFRGNYVSLVYGKSVLFLQALRQQLGEPAFDRFIRAFYDERRYRYVGGADLLLNAELACGCELDQLYRDWVLTVAPVSIP